jgi:predicted nucleic acid-binding protein
LILTVDASVALKWFFRDRDDEADIDAALDILRAVADGRAKLVPPPHFMAEMTAVLAREAPTTASANIEDLRALAFSMCDADLLYLRAAELATQFKHHAFDTLYHAAALLTPDAVLVTADAGYFKKAKSLGRIELLSDWVLSGDLPERLG